MGIYINPKNTSKREWLDRHAIKVGIINERGSKIPSWEFFTSNCRPVVLMDEEAAGIAYSEKEYKRLTEKDNREKIIYEAPKEDLSSISVYKIRNN
jgi:hypothetical protein